MSQSEPDVLALTEPCLNKRIKDAEVALNNITYLELKEIQILCCSFEE